MRQQTASAKATISPEPLPITVLVDLYLSIDTGAHVTFAPDDQLRVYTGGVEANTRSAPSSSASSLAEVLPVVLRSQEYGFLDHRLFTCPFGYRFAY
jgi:hypothetical protein